MGNPMPVVAMFCTDFLYSLVLIEDTDTIDEVAAKCAEHSIGRRVPTQQAPMQVAHSGTVLDGSKTVVEAGISPMDEVIVSYATI